MEDLNEDDLIMYEESKEIKETIWKVWDIINDKEIILKLLLNTSLLNYIKNSQPNNPLESKENDNSKNQDNSNNDLNKNKSEENGKFIFYIIYFNIYIYRL